MATTTKTPTTTKKTTKKAAPKKGPAKAGDKAASAAKAAKAPTTAPKAQDAARAKDGADAGKPRQSPKAALAQRSKTKAGQATVANAPKVEVLTEAEAAKRGMTEILKTLKGKDAAMRQAAKAGGFVIEHEDGRYSAAKAQPETEAPTDAPEADQPEAPAKPKHSLETAPGKALDHMLKEGRRRIKEKAKAAENAAAAKGGKAKGGGQAKPAKAPKAKKVSALDAAAQVLAKAKQPMRAKELIEQMAAEGLWTSPGGKTPEATLYAAMIREISKKGDEARFAKADRGSFVATANAGKGA